jgi:hypothetical protein
MLKTSLTMLTHLFALSRVQETKSPWEPFTGSIGSHKRDAGKEEEPLGILLVGSKGISKSVV